ncbi:carbon-monoxide dehydrogenase small subunit [Marinitoga hydrogenitolerans DSM 16785]|uniref:Carbon-monoxide dehydrogenase small subunit n=1 Tax=Marinitoga hydrogenitolerans (strain DSM 16785 / JCM 12826 / AT1271) TaxID=1122195 RepID=A0A1M4T3H6_MARH1|nr:(2Fe-2S)-binding protein [Marinitoga hydrogenitolerans]SHE39026.1 carbon-monoxide dehydrogenase small subunit [Marinitoga hydrogenitolerans DSM 16785]
MKIKLTINNEKKEVEITASEFLLDVLRRLDYMSVKKGCDTGTCGVCTVLMDGKPVLSCSVLAASADGHEITTVEGLKDDPEFKAISEALLNEGADQCGFCSPGLILNVYSMKKELKDPTEEDMKKYLVGNLCRCTGYAPQMRAIKKYFEVKA